MPEMTGVTSTSHHVKQKTRIVPWKLVIENACQDFVDEQLRREPFCSVSLIEGKLHNLTSRLNVVEHALVCGHVFPHAYRVSCLPSPIIKDADSEKIFSLESRGVKADGECGPVEPATINRRFSLPFFPSWTHRRYNI